MILTNGQPRKKKTGAASFLSLLQIKNDYYSVWIHGNKSVVIEWLHDPVITISTIQSFPRMKLKEIIFPYANLDKN